MFGHFVRSGRFSSSRKLDFSKTFGDKSKKENAMKKVNDIADAEDLAFSGYPIGSAAKHYAQRVKPALRIVARELGYTVGSYYGHGCPSTTLVAQDSSDVATVDLQWRYSAGRMTVTASLVTKASRTFRRTPFGQVVTAMSWGVGDATGYSDKSARSLRDVVTSAVRDAEKNLAAKGGTPCAATK
jgi:hypothetical protein